VFYNNTWGNTPNKQHNIVVLSKWIIFRFFRIVLSSKWFSFCFLQEFLRQSFAEGAIHFIANSHVELHRVNLYKNLVLGNYALNQRKIKKKKV